MCDLWHVGPLLLDVIPLDLAGARGSYFTVAVGHMLRPHEEGKGALKLQLFTSWLTLTYLPLTYPPPWVCVQLDPDLNLALCG